MSTKVQNRLNTIEKQLARQQELISTGKYKTGSVLHDLHTMIDNSGFLLHNIMGLIEARKTTEQQHQKQMQSMFTRVNLQDSFIKSKGQLNEYNLYEKDTLDKQKKAKEEAEARAKADATTEGSDRTPSPDPPPGSEGNPGE